jgi:hypothetical protein
MNRMLSPAALVPLLLIACADAPAGPVAPDEALSPKGGRDFAFTTIEVPGASLTV